MSSSISWACSTQTAKALLDSPDFLRLGLMLGLERRPVEPRARTMFLQVRAQAFQQLTKDFRDLLPALTAAEAHQLVAYGIAAADGLFIAKEIGGDAVDLVALFEMHGQAMYDLARRLIDEKRNAMRLTGIDVGEAADLLHAAQIGRAPIDPLTERYPGLDVADAYAIQQVNLSRRLADGQTLVGHKIGLTSQPMQALLGVDEPDFGYILDDMVLARGAAVSAARFCAPRVEPEVASCCTGRCTGPGSRPTTYMPQRKRSPSRARSSTAGSRTGD